MAAHQISFLFIFPTILFPTLACPDDDLYKIKCAVFTGFALDGSDSSQVKIQYNKGESIQLWRFETGDRAGLYYIVNNKTGKVLDYEPANDGWMNLITKEKRNVLRQQWSLTVYGRIVNAENRRAIDVSNADFSVGNRVVVLDPYNGEEQWFILEKFGKSEKCGQCEMR